jgi:phosphoribosyl 1,2-cyclic phosphodiesterase
MPSDRLQLRFHGVRGSVPSPGLEMVRYGGDTICIEVGLGDPRHRLLLDCGTGLRHVDVDPEDPEGSTVDVLLSHFHWDHLEGLGFFPPLFQPQHRLNFRGRPEGMGVREALEGALRPPWFPVGIAETPSTKTYEDLDGSPFTIGDIEIVPLTLNHPQGVTGYRFNSDRGAIAIATDHEAATPDEDAELVEWARGVDLLVHDAQYTEDDYEPHRGWGHSTWAQAVESAIACEAGRLLTISHDPNRTDDQIDALVAEARRRFPSTEAAAAGMVASA